MVTGKSVGVDYHEKELQVCVMSSDGRVESNRRVTTEVGSLLGVLSEVGSVKSVVAEACNGSAEFLYRVNKSSGVRVKLCHPGYTSRMRHNPDKTDKSDGELLADLERVGYLPEVWLAPREIRDLRSLSRFRFQLTKRIREEKLRIGGLLRNWRVSKCPVKSLWTKAGRVWLQEAMLELPEHAAWVLAENLEALKAAEESRARVLKRLEAIAESEQMLKWLMSHKGIGIVTAVTLAAEIGDFNRFRNGKQLARFCSLTPRNVSSGERQADAGLIRAGNPQLRYVLMEAAHSLIRFDAYWKEKALAMKERGKPTSVVVAAIANRWMRKLFYAAREQQNMLPLAA